MLPISSSTINQNGVRIVRNDGAVWETTRDQVLLMLAANSLKNVISALRDSLATFLAVEPTQITRQVKLAGKITGEMTLVLDYSEE